MKKRLLLIVLMGICLFTGCVSEKKESIKITDPSLKLTTTFYYNENDGFKFEKEVKGGKYAEIEFSNEKSNLYFNAYYINNSSDNSKADKDHVMYDTYYKEYYYNDCVAYSYGLDDNRLTLVIPLKNDGENETSLMVIISEINPEKKSVVFNKFNDEKIQNFFKSLILTED